ncbi:MAG: four helix bundle protein [Sphingobacteriales bacterium]|nr:MAG: four helix bundle protein [Sphingobacteriales bacterium]
MATFNRFEEIFAWQIARELCREIHRITRETPLAKDFKLRDQINDSAESIPSNIAEGFGRGGNKEFVQFLEFAHGSCAETQSHLYYVLDRGYINQEEFDNAYRMAAKTSRAIYKLIEYLQKSEIRGPRFRK